IYPINDCKRYKICSTWIVEFIFSAQDSMAFNQRYLILDFYKNQLMVGDSQSVGTRAGRSRQRGLPFVEDEEKIPEEYQILVEAKPYGEPFIRPYDWGYHNCFTPIDLLDYIYAVLHSPTYREKY